MVLSLSSSDAQKLTIHQLFEQLGSSKSGLSQREAHGRRISLSGSSQSFITTKSHAIGDFIKQLTNPLVLILIAASIISAYLGEKENAAIITAIVIISISIDYFQQRRAEKAVKKLQAQVAVTTTVIRDGRLVTIPTASVVVGDILVITPGKLIPADAKIIEATDLLVDESSLTGESYPVQKSASDQNSIVSMDTSVVSGEATAVVFACGTDTKFGKTAGLIAAKPPQTSFEVGISSFSVLIMKITLFLVLVVFLVNALFKGDILTSFLFALALAIGLTPELLPIILTLTLSYGAIRMAKKGVIVKHLPAIENLGSMDVLCTDKTGTLTENKIRLERYEDATGRENKDILLWGYINSFFQGRVNGPLDEAILKHHHPKVRQMTKIAVIPFDFTRKCNSTIIKDGKGTVLICKGAPEQIVAASSYYADDGTQSLSEKKRTQLLKRYEQLSSDGFRVLALASKHIDQRDQYTVADENQLTFLGFMAFLDPPKESAAEALSIMEKQEIAIKILTGDNELVTKKICDELKIPVSGSVDGETLRKATPQVFAHYVETATIFARITPDQKQEIIKHLQATGRVVGFLGDGINDAPALKQADVGVSVDNACDIAKDTASFILLKTDLHVLKEGVYEGRKTYANTMKYILMVTSSNFGNMFSMAFASIVLPFLPMLPVQILLNNLLSDLSQIAIPTDHVDHTVIKKPRKWNMHLIKRFMIIFGPISSVFDIVTFLVLAWGMQVTVTQFQTGWFIESLVSQAIIIMTIRTIKTPFFKGRPSGLLVAAVVTCVAFAVLLPYSPVASYFSFSPPPPLFYAFLVLIVTCYVLCVDYTKAWFFRRYGQ